MSKPKEEHGAENKQSQTIEVEEVKTKVDLSQEARLAKLDQFDNAGEMLAFAEVLIRGKTTSIKTPEQLVTIIQQGRELNMGAVTAMNNIYPIDSKNGVRLTLSKHLVGALVERAGVAWKTIKNYEPVYETSSDTGDYNYYKIVEGKPVKSTKEEGGKRRKIDTETVIRFYKPWKNIIIEEDVSFTWNEAVLQGLADGSKYNWNTMPKIMLWTRCFVLGARQVCPSALLGMMETSEAIDVENLQVELDEEGHIKTKSK